MNSPETADPLNAQRGSSARRSDSGSQQTLRTFAAAPSDRKSLARRAERNATSRMYARDVSDRARRPAIVVSDLGSSELENWTAEDQGNSDARNAFIGPPPSVAARGGRPRSRILELGSWMLGLGRIVRHSLSEAHDEGSDEAF